MFATILEFLFKILLLIVAVLFFIGSLERFNIKDEDRYDGR